MNNDELKSNLLSSKHWLRLVFMLLFALILQLAGLVMWGLVILQFLFSLITGRDNRNLRQFGQSLSLYIFHTLQFLTYNSEDKPFPFSDWPSSEDETQVPAKSRARATGTTKRTRSPRPKSTAKKVAPATEAEPDTDKDA
jgi:hypothetical protein